MYFNTLPPAAELPIMMCTGIPGTGYAITIRVPLVVDGVNRIRAIQFP